MAFPTGYSKYQAVTVDHTKVSGALTDFPTYVNLANMVKAGADIFDTCRTDGGDIRATLSDGTTQLATELVTIDTTAKTGELWVKIPSLSISVDTVIWIWYNGTDTALAASDTYGSENVWDSNYKAVWHMNQDPSGGAPQIINSVAGGADGTSSGSMTSGDSVAVKVGNGLDFDGSDDTVTFGDTCDELNTGTSTIEFWASCQQINDLLFKKALAANGGFQILSRGDSKIYFEYGNNAGTDWFASRLTASTYVDSTVRHWVGTFSGSGNGIIIYVNGTAEGSNAYASVGALASGNTSNFTMGGAAGTGLLGKLDEVRISNTVRTTSYISTCYANQNSPATFYSVGDEVSSAPAFLAKATMRFRQAINRASTY